MDTTVKARMDGRFLKSLAPTETATLELQAVSRERTYDPTIHQAHQARRTATG